MGGRLMDWREAGGVEWLEAALPAGKVSFSTRSAGSVKDSLAPLATALGLAPERIATARQVHGTELAFHEETRAGGGVEADGHVIAAPGAFAGLGAGTASGRMLDLAEVTRRLLRRSGVEEIESAGLCTSCEEELFFSHRRDAGPGRQAGLAWVEAGED